MDEVNSSTVAVIIPALNEEDSIGLLLQNLNRVLKKPSFLVVNGNSADKTAEIAKDFGAEIIYQNGSGKGSALRQAFDYNTFDSDFVVIIDADLSMNPKEISSFIKALESGADVVKGSRCLPNSHSDDFTPIRKLGNKFFVSLVNFIWSTNYTDLCYGFMAFRKDALKKLSKNLTSNRFEIEAEICIKSKKLGLIVKEVPSIEHKRPSGGSNLNLIRDSLRIFLKILSLAFDTSKDSQAHLES